MRWVEGAEGCLQLVDAVKGHFHVKTEEVNWEFGIGWMKVEGKPSQLREVMRLFQ